MVQRQLMDGPHDGLFVVVPAQATVFVAPDGLRYILAIDARMYLDACQWEGKPYDANPGVCA